MGKEKEKLTEDQKVQYLLGMSGHGLHLRIASSLNENKKSFEKWDIAVSSYYVDSVTDKARETDIIATRTYSNKVHQDLFTPWDFKFRLGIECKYLTEPAVFWVAEHEMNPAASFIQGWNIEELFENGLLDRHHYFDSDRKIAYLSAVYGGEARSDDKKLSEALISTIQGLAFKVGSGKSFNYPIIVTSGAGLYLQDGTTIDEVLHYVDYAYRDPKSERISEKQYYVHIVTEKALPGVLAQIERTANWVAEQESLRSKKLSPPAYKENPGR